MKDYLPASGWRQVARDATSILFVASATDGSDPPWRSITVDLAGGRWTPGGGGGCDLRTVVARGVGPASWSLDPAFPAPLPVDTTVHVQVWERACASGQPATGRVVGPLVTYGANEVTITFGVREPVGQGQTCQSNPPTPTVIELTEPLGARALLDGGTFPAQPPKAPFSRR